jgi:hypothetical protein
MRNNGAKLVLIVAWFTLVILAVACYVSMTGNH